MEDLITTSELKNRIKNNKWTGMWLMVGFFVSMGSAYLFDEVLYFFAVIILQLAVGIAITNSIYKMQLELRIRKGGKNGI